MPPHVATEVTGSTSKQPVAVVTATATATPAASSFTAATTTAK